MRLTCTQRKQIIFVHTKGVHLYKYVSNMYTQNRTSYTPLTLELCGNDKNINTHIDYQSGIYACKHIIQRIILKQ